jgi:tetratricopeptide (TPR) repeat protein
VEVGHPIEQHLHALAESPRIPWDQLFETTTDSPVYDEAARQGAFYAQSWLLVHYLVAAEERAKQLNRYLTLLRDGTAEEQAFATAFGIERAALGAAAENYLERGSNYVWWDLGEERGTIAVELRELPVQEVLTRLGDLLAHRGAGGGLAQHLDAALAAGAPAATVHAARGVAALATRDLGAAEPHLRAAIEGPTPTAEAHVLLAEILLDRHVQTAAAQPATAGVPPPVLEVRSILERGLVAHPGDFHALVALARTYLFDAGDPRPGIEALAQARSQRPLDAYSHLTSVCLLALDGRPKEAWSVLERQLAPRDPDLASQAGGCLVDGISMAARRRLEAQDRAGAQQILDAAMREIHDSRLTADLAGFQRALAAGQQIRFADSAGAMTSAATAVDPVEAYVTEYNEAARLAEAGQLDEALARFERLAESCVDEEVCEAAVKSASSIQHNRWVERYNAAVTLLNEGDRKRSVERLQALEQEVEDPELLAAIQELLRSVGARPRRQ